MSLFWSYVFDNCRLFETMFFEKRRFWNLMFFNAAFPKLFVWKCRFFKTCFENFQLFEAFLFNDAFSKFPFKAHIRIISFAGWLCFTMFYVVWVFPMFFWKQNAIIVKTHTRRCRIMLQNCQKSTKLQQFNKPVEIRQNCQNCWKLSKIIKIAKKM